MQAVFLAVAQCHLYICKLWKNELKYPNLWTYSRLFVICICVCICFSTTNSGVRFPNLLFMLESIMYFVRKATCMCTAIFLKNTWTLFYSRKCGDLITWPNPLTHVAASSLHIVIMLLTGFDGKLNFPANWIRQLPGLQNLFTLEIYFPLSESWMSWEVSKSVSHIPRRLCYKVLVSNIKCVSECFSQGQLT